MTKKKKVKKKSHNKQNIVKIQVEAKSPKRRKAKKKPRKISKPKVSVEKVQVEMQPILVENFTALQKVMINLAGKIENSTLKNEKLISEFSDLSAKIERLLELFEISAKSLAKEGFKVAGEASPELMKKINELSEQNKIIAKGLTTLHETRPPAPTAVKPLIPAPTPHPPKPVGEEGYKKSVSFKPLPSE